MKHLRRFNEGNIDALDELKDFCEGNLAFLLDDLIKINYIYKGQVTYGTCLTNKDGTPRTITHDIYMIEIGSIIDDSYDSQVKWDDIKDYFIPFLDRLSSEVYKIQGWFDNDDIVMIRSIKQQGTRFIKVTNTYDYYEITKDKVREDKFWSLSIKVEI